MSNCERSRSRVIEIRGVFPYIYPKPTSTESSLLMCLHDAASKPIRGSHIAGVQCGPPGNNGYELPVEFITSFETKLVMSCAAIGE
jgi:hypothetical protein